MQPFVQFDINNQNSGSSSQYVSKIILSSTLRELHVRSSRVFQMLYQNAGIYLLVLLMLTESPLRTPLITKGTGSLELLGSSTPSPLPPLILNAFRALN